jgi:hypothetical protein
MDIDSLIEEAIEGIHFMPAGEIRRSGVWFRGGASPRLLVNCYWLMGKGQRKVTRLRLTSAAAGALA